MECVDKEGHEYVFIGYMVVCEDLPRKNPGTPMAPPLPRFKGIASPNTIIGFPQIEVPAYFAAKIEVHQCEKCGNIKLQQAVFSRILAKDKTGK